MISRPPRVQQVARPVDLPEGVPRYSDVCFSSRWEHPVNENDSLETFSAAGSFHATYLNWVYTTNPDFIRKADSLGYKLQVALTPALSDLPFNSRTYQNGRIVNSEGKNVTAPWMQGWDNWWGCVNHPAFQETYLAYIRAALAAGATGFQVDDPAMGYVLVRNKWEDVCYCSYCLNEAAARQLEPSEIQQISVQQFHETMKTRAAEIAGRPVPFSCNNFRGDWELFPHDLFDFGVAEVPPRRANPEYIYSAMRETRKRGKAQVFSFVSDKEWLIQKMIATTYACGGNLLVPWDVWQGGGQPRYFGRPEEFASWYGFVRANAAWLDGYEDAFYTTTQDDIRFTDTRRYPLRFTEYRRQLHAFVRAVPRSASAPVVVHLVDWEILTEDFSIQLKEKLFFEKGIGKIVMRTPVDYDPAIHESADFDKMYREEQLPMARNGERIDLEIPKLEKHWAILLLYPSKH